MTSEAAVKYADSMEPNLAIPSAIRPKSWLLVMSDPSGNLHFYDCTDSPAKALSRLSNSAGTAQNELLEIIPYAGPKDAAMNRNNFVSVLKLAEYLKSKITRPISQTQPLAQPRQAA